MKKKKVELKQLNSKTIIKLIIFIALIIVLEVATGLFAYYQFSSRTYRKEYATYAKTAEDLGKSVYGKLPDSFNDLEGDEAALQAVAAELKASEKFDYYVIFSPASGGRIIDGGGVLSDENGATLEGYNLVYNKVGLVEIGDKTYVFAPAAMGNVYCVGGVSDFTERQAVIDNLRANVAAALVVSGVLLTLAFVVYAYTFKQREKTENFKYVLTLDKSGKVVRSNAAFKREFSAVGDIKAVDSMNNKDFNLINLNAVTGQKLVAMRVNAGANRTRVYAGDVANAESFISTSSNEELDIDGKSTTSLSKVFESFITRGKRTLLGVLFISSLDQIKTLFGKQMALEIQKIILKKVREKFTYAYEIDFAYIGVTYPDGKKLDNILSDMEDINRYINAPIKMEDNLFTLDIKSGFALCDAAMIPLDFNHAYKAAEAARQRVIDTKIADYVVYHESQRKLYAKYFITYDIKQMLAEGAFEMEYQPQYNIKQERIEGFEALFRVKKSWNVNVDTFSFITYAERTGAMVQLGDFIFDTGMQFAKKLAGKNVSVSLNVSPVQLMQAGFTENFLNLYKKYNLTPGSICVEITESFLMTNFNETLKKLAILTSNGIDVHLDDFGTEYSSLLYIKKLPISTIKIDKEFVKDVLTSKESQAVIKFITNIAKLLNLTTICEGVETPQEFDMLNYLGCDTIQGWIIGKSMKPDAALEIVDTFDYKKAIAAREGK